MNLVFKLVPVAVLVGACQLLATTVVAQVPETSSGTELAGASEDTMPLLARQVENAKAALEVQEAALHQRLMGETKRVKSLVDTLIRELSSADDQTQALASELQTLAQEYESVVRRLFR